MKVLTSQLRRVISEQILLSEARYQLKNLMIFKETMLDETHNLFDAVNESFIENGGRQHDLNNQKAAGRFFIDVLFECMEEINEIIEGNNAGMIDIPDMIMSISSWILFLFNNKEVTARTVTSGQNFKDYILDFMTNYNRISYPGASTVYEKLEYVFDRLNEKAMISSLEAIVNNLKFIKSDAETMYPFGPAVKEGYMVVAPKTTRSSIFWARTNWLGEELVLYRDSSISGTPGITWCTARYKGANMFNTYFSGGGTTLFYFLPEGNVAGFGKFCIGITKRLAAVGGKKKKGVLPADWQRAPKDFVVNQKYHDNPHYDVQDDYEVYKYEKYQKNPSDWEYQLTIGGYTTVNHNNQPLFKNDMNDFNSPEVRDKLTKELGVSNSLLTALSEAMKDREAADVDRFISLLDVEQVASVTNLDNLAPIDPITGGRDKLQVSQIATQIQNIMKVYNSNLYKAKGYSVDEKIVNYLEKNYLYFAKEGVSLPFMIPKKCHSNSAELSKYFQSLINFQSQNFKNVTLMAGETNAYKVLSKALENVNITDDLAADIILLFLLNAKDFFPFFNSYFSNTKEGISKFYEVVSIEKLSKKYNFSAEISNHMSFQIIKRIGPSLKNLGDDELFNLYTKHRDFAIALLISSEYLNKYFGDQELVNLFFENPHNIKFIQNVSKEYFKDKPDLVLKIAEVFSRVTDYDGENLACVFTYFNDITREQECILPDELLMNKQLFKQLMNIHQQNFRLYQYFKFSNEDKNSPDLLEIIVPDKFIEDKMQNGENITIEYLNNLIKINPLAFSEISNAFLNSTNVITDNYRNIIIFLTEYLNDYNNIYKLLSSKDYYNYIDYSPEMYQNYIAYGRNFAFLIKFLFKSFSAYRFVTHMQKKYKEAISPQDLKLFKNFKAAVKNLVSDMKLISDITNLMKNQRIRNIKKDIPLSDQFVRKDFYHLSMAVDEMKHIDAGLSDSEYTTMKETIEQVKTTTMNIRYLPEARALLRKNKLIISEQTLRNLIRRNLCNYNY